MAVTHHRPTCNHTIVHAHSLVHSSPVTQPKSGRCPGVEFDTRYGYLKKHGHRCLKMPLPATVRLNRSSLKLKLKRVEHVSPQVKNLKSIFIYRQELKDNSPKSKERQKCGTFRNKCFALITACWLEHHNKHVQHHLRNRLNTFHRTTAYEKQDEQRRLTCRYVLFSDYSRL